MISLVDKLRTYAKVFAPHEADATLAREAADEIETLRGLIAKTRPYVAELASFSSAAEKHRDLTEEIDAVLHHGQ